MVGARGREAGGSLERLRKKNRVFTWRKKRKDEREGGRKEGRMKEERKLTEIKAKKGR